MDYKKEYTEALASAIESKKKWISEALAKEAKKYLCDIGGGCTDHEAYREKVLPYWERFGYVPEEFWFSLAGSRDGVMDPRFMPADLLYTEIIPYLNNMQIVRAIDDKACYDIWFAGAKQAPTVCRRVAGIWYDDGMNMISDEEALQLCMDRSCELFIKPSMYTSGGHSIHTADSSATSSGELAAILKETGANLIVQEEIEQHPALASLNPDSVCTIRITTLLMDGEVHVAHELLRVGARGEKVLLRGKGNYVAQIMDDGRLHEKAMFFDPVIDETGEEGYPISWTAAADKGLYDSEFRVPSMDAVRKSAKMLHERIAHLRYIGWDFTVDREGEPVMIEINCSPGHVHGQTGTCTPMFGDMTDRVLEDFFFERTLEKNQRQGMLIQ